MRAYTFSGPFFIFFILLLLTGTACVPAPPAHCGSDCALMALLTNSTTNADGSAPGTGGSGSGSRLHIFVTAATHTGDFDTDATLGGNSDGSGFAEADTFCQNDSARPTTGTYRALLVGNAAPARRASLTANLGNNRLDWVLKPLTEYYRSDGTTRIFTTNANAIFVFGTLDASMDIPGNQAYTGLQNDWTTHADNCQSWSAGAPQSGRRGLVNVNNSMAIDQGSNGCSAPRYIICVEQ